MENKVTTITLKFDRVLEERPKAVKLQIPFTIKGEDKEYYWGFWLPKSKVLVGNDNRVIIPVSFIHQLKLNLQHHSFNKVRYVARFYNYRIRFIKA